MFKYGEYFTYYNKEDQDTQYVFNVPLGSFMKRLTLNKVMCK